MLKRSEHMHLSLLLLHKNGAQSLKNGTTEGSTGCYYKINLIIFISLNVYRN